jgi:RHS repeat-associated protein
VLEIAIDANGNVLTDPSGKQYTWDFENRLTQVVVPGTGTVAFKYDPFDRRIYKSSPTWTGIFAYDGPNLIETVNSSGTLVSRYTQSAGIDAPLAALRGSSTSFYEQDGLNSVTSLSNSTGALANTYTYDSFGNLTASTGGLLNPFQYTGREADAETGVYYYRARYYDPNSGRFLSEDWDREGLNKSLYSYVGNNPGIFVDPSGLVARLYCEIIPIGRGRTLGQQIGLAISHPAHCYLYVSCHGSGHYLELYGPPVNGSHGIPHNDQPFNLERANNSTQQTLTPPPGMGCCEFENRLDRAFDDQAANLPEYNASGPNSNTFVNNIIWEAGGTGNFPWNAYGSNYGLRPPSGKNGPSCCGGSK